MTAGSATPRASRSPRSMRSRRSMARVGGADRRRQCRRRHRHDLPRVQGRHRHRLARRRAWPATATRSARWCRRITARATCCASTACRSGARSAATSCRRTATRRATRRLDHRRPGDRCAAAADPVPAPGAPRDDRASPGSAASAPTAAATSSLPSPPATISARTRRSATLRMLAPDAMTPLFQAAAEATEEAILNALTAAETMTGLNGRTRPRPAARPAPGGDAALPAPPCSPGANRREGENDAAAIHSVLFCRARSCSVSNPATAS